uniref:Tantalus-like domain-containing protein n=1 Tax=Ciona savignyi TaxID=51511 RepID=H2ZRA4_CIOSA
MEIYQDDPELLELIKLVAVGQSSINRLSGKFHSPCGKKLPKHKDFDPLLPPVAESSRLAADDARPNKRTRLSFESSPILENSLENHRIPRTNENSEKTKCIIETEICKKVKENDSAEIRQNRSCVLINNLLPEKTNQSEILNKKENFVEKSEKNNEGDPTAQPSGRLLRKRIRKTLPPLKVRPTPLGLARPLRVKRDNFTVEEIYMNRNYSTPTMKAWETIFEEPKQDKEGKIRYAEKTKKRRAVFFPADPSTRAKKRKVASKKKRGRRSKQSDDSAINERLIKTLHNLDLDLQLNGLSP